MMSSIAVLAQELLGDHVKSHLEGRRAARLRQIPPDSQMPAQGQPHAEHLPPVQISLSSGLSKICGMCCATLKHASNLKCSLQGYRKHEYQRWSNHPGRLQCGGTFTPSLNAADGLAFALFGTNMSNSELCSKWPRSPSGSKPAVSVLLRSKHLK